MDIYANLDTNVSLNRGEALYCTRKICCVEHLHYCLHAAGLVSINFTLIYMEHINRSLFSFLLFVQEDKVSKHN